MEKIRLILQFPGYSFFDLKLVVPAVILPAHIDWELKTVLKLQDYISEKAFDKIIQDFGEKVDVKTVYVEEDGQYISHEVKDKFENLINKGFVISDHSYPIVSLHLANDTNQ